MTSEQTNTSNGEENNPYEKDALGRSAYARNLGKLIDRLPKGVIAIDGEWGCGKTWFGERLRVDLNRQLKFRTAWIDSFQADWTDDPTTSLIASIVEQLEDEKKETFFKKISPYLAKVTPIFARAALNTAGNLIGLDKESLDEISSAGGKVTEVYVQKHLEEASSKSKNLETIKELITECIKEQDKKLVVFIDELDRCSPAYAVKFLEKIKHLFDLSNVIYILLWNRKQIQNSIEIFYGSGTNGQMYLDKFIDFPVFLPVSQITSYGLPHIQLIRSIINSETMIANSRLEINVDWIATVSAILNLTAREVKHISVWYVLSNNRPFEIIEIWLLGLKVKYPDVFAGIRNGDKESHAKVVNILEQITIDMRSYSDVVIDLKTLHNSFAANDLNSASIKNSGLFYSYDQIDTCFNAAIRRLEQEF